MLHEWPIKVLGTRNCEAFARAVRLWSVVALALALAACASRPDVGALLSVDTPDPLASTHRMLVATTRQRDDRPGTLFNGERAAKLDFASLDISVPSKHQPGEIEWPAKAPGNPATDFVVRGAGYLDSDAQFVDALNRQLGARPPGQRKVLLFVHGYNTLFAEAVYRFVQVEHDSGSRAVPVLFTWASRGSVGEYVYDNNSATAARDELERTIRMLFASNAEEVNILAHSMGNWVTVESLRQIKLSGQVLPLKKLGSIVLAAPDIDVDVFKAQIRRFGRPPKPFFIILSKDDKALGLSNWIAGGKPRLGAGGDIAELTALGAVVIDLTDVKADDSSNHSKFAQLATIAPQLRAVLARGVANVASASPDQQPGGSGLGPLVDVPVSILGVPVKIFTRR